MKKATTTTYLTLPGYNTLQREYKLHHRLSLFDPWSLESGYAFPIDVSEVPTDASLRRFFAQTIRGSHENT